MELMKGFFEHWNRVQDVTLRLIRQIPQDKLSFKPTEKNFPLQELVTHIYWCERVFAETGVRGEMKMEDFSIWQPPEIKTVDDLYNYAKETHEITNKYYGSMSAEDLMKPIKTPWGDMSVFVHLNSAYEHLWHHRGQMYVYLRLVGVENPVFLFDYGKVEVEA